jgi:hypothetical protein
MPRKKDTRPRCEACDVPFDEPPPIVRKGTLRNGTTMTLVFCTDSCLERWLRGWRALHGVRAEAA